MRPSKDTLDFSLNENGTSSYVFYDKRFTGINGYHIQLSWYTSKPHQHFVKKVLPVDNNLWQYYPLENSYDWHYDYHIDDVCLHQCKYFHAPSSILKLCHRNYTFDECACQHETLIGLRNLKIVEALNKTTNYGLTIHPTEQLIDDDTDALSGVLDYIHQKDVNKKILGSYSGRLNPFKLNTQADDDIMQLMGYGFIGILVMKKILKARVNHEQRQRPNVIPYW